MIGPRYQNAYAQSGFYQNNFRRLVNLLFISVIIMASLSASVLYFVLVKPTPHYYVMTEEGKIITLQPANS